MYIFKAMQYLHTLYVIYHYYQAIVKSLKRC